jgi:hypothetical protein
MRYEELRSALTEHFRGLLNQAKAEMDDTGPLNEMDRQAYETSKRVAKHAKKTDAALSLVKSDDDLLARFINERGEVVGIPRSKDRLDKQSRYRPTYMTTNRFLMVQNWLQKAGHMALDKRGYHFPDNAQVSMFKLTTRAAFEFEADALTVRDFRIDRPDDPVVLKDSQGQLCRYDDTLEASAIRMALNQINERLDATAITTSRALTYLDSDRDFVGTRVNLVDVPPID